ncbi:helix-turn-helix domain-containing protein [Actinocorallia populi]|uniref:helix-turn-helix domain-containing protein n=1 Tax=Actinocorallia populi TaxID=2079200 RepID=UPI001E2AD108|nr:helix-turn-helix transcriptional regulator [Actinocorallia populi]
MESALLREEIVRARKDAGFTQEQVAAALEWSPSKLLRIEGGKSGITRTDLSALLNHYGVTSESRQQRLQELARGARERPWWSGYRGLLRDAYLTFVGYEAGASYLRHYHSSVFPGLLQLEDYAAVLSTRPGEETTAATRPAVKLRLERQRHLAERADPPKMQFLLDESVLRRQIGVRRDPGVQQRQIRHAVEIARTDPRVEIQVVPFGVGFHAGLYVAGFTLLEFDGPLDDVLYIEAGRDASQLITGGLDPVSDYRAYYQEVMDEAMTPDKSLEFMLEVAEELDRL